MKPVQGKTALGRSKIHGWGVFAVRDIKAGEVVECMPVLAFPIGKFDDNHCYYRTDAPEMWVGTGTCSWYNTGDDPSATYVLDWDYWIIITAARTIHKGEEIILAYEDSSATTD